MLTKSSVLPFNPLKNIIAQIILNKITAISKEINKSLPSLNEIYFSLSSCPKPELGQITYGCFTLAKHWQMTPIQIASLLHKEFETQIQTPLLKSNPTGPYLNFQLDLNKVLTLLIEKIQDGQFFKPKFFHEFDKVMVEYSQPNTHKEMHVGHMRNVCLGSALVKLYQYLGHEVITCTYPGDMGTHVAKCLWYYKKNNLSPPPERKGAWLGSIYSKAHQELEAQRGTDQEEKNRVALTHILQEMHSGKGEYFNLWKETRQWSLDLMKDTYSWIDVEFDHWFFESEVDKKSLELAQQYYQKGILTKDDGAIGIDLSSDGLGFCLLIKSDGNGLYATKDLELARHKMDNFKITKNIYVVDNRQSLHFKQVFKTLEKMGFKNLAESSYHLAYEMVELPDGAMSSRKGNIIPIQTLTDEMESTIKNQYLHKYINVWSDTEIQECAHRIANAAIKYGMLKIDPVKKIVFDLAEWLKIDGNSGPYLLYSYARAGAILQKANFDPKSQFSSSWSFTQKAETDLLMKIWTFNEAVYEAASKNSPNILGNYLYELCQELNTFYAQCSIMNASTIESKLTRLTLVNNFRQVLQSGLNILNIKTVERM